MMFYCSKCAMQSCGDVKNKMELAYGFLRNRKNIPGVFEGNKEKEQKGAKVRVPKGKPTAQTNA